MKTVTVKAKAWITNWNDVHPSDLEDGKRITALTFSELDSDMSWAKWTLAGDAEITVHLNIPKEDMVAERVKALREELSEVRAKHAGEVKRIEDKIHKLLAITHVVTEADPF